MAKSRIDKFFSSCQVIICSGFLARIGWSVWEFYASISRSDSALYILVRSENFIPQIFRSDYGLYILVRSENCLPQFPEILVCAIWSVQRISYLNFRKWFLFVHTPLASNFLKSVFTLALSDFSLKSEWHQISSGLQDSSKYPNQFQWDCGLNGLDSSFDLQFPQPFFRPLGSFQAHLLHLISPPPSCCTTFLSLWQSPVIC